MKVAFWTSCVKLIAFFMLVWFQWGRISRGFFIIPLTLVRLSRRLSLFFRSCLYSHFANSVTFFANSVTLSIDICKDKKAMPWLVIVEWDYLNCASSQKQRLAQIINSWFAQSIWSWYQSGLIYLDPRPNSFWPSNCYVRFLHGVALRDTGPMIGKLLIKTVLK